MFQGPGPSCLVFFYKLSRVATLGAETHGVVIELLEPVLSPLTVCSPFRGSGLGISSV